ncbi:MAG: hypothetical protein PHI06_11890 [Desulfobulbaceae bacterium]|nr:hypothetical protein [Desulfobulbaceae bacterium]
MESRKKISLVVLGALCCLQFAGAAMAAEDKPTADLSVSVLSKYVWRGFELSKDSLVIQPSMTVAYKGFSANVWGNEDTDVYVNAAEGAGTNNWTETDFTLAYDWSMGMVDLTAGYIYYGLIGKDSQEIFGRVALNVLLTPTLSVYRDYDGFPGWYATLGISHSVPITEKINLDLGAQVGYLSADDASTYPEYNGVGNATTNSYSGFHDGLLTASVSIPVTEYVSVTPVLNYSFPLTSDAGDLIESLSQEVANGSTTGKDNFIYGGVTLSMAF